MSGEDFAFFRWAVLAWPAVSAGESRARDRVLLDMWPHVRRKP